MNAGSVIPKFAASLDLLDQNLKMKKDVINLNAPSFIPMHAATPSKVGHVLGKIVDFSTSEVQKTSQKKHFFLCPDQ